MPDQSRLLVTGSTGFIGRHFCERYGGIPLRSASGNINLSDTAAVQAAVAEAQPEAVLHLAGQSSVASSFQDPRKTHDVNFFGTLNLLEALAAAQFKGTFLLVSSADVYGTVPTEELPIGECRALSPRSPYAVSKVSAEALCFQWSQTSAFRCVTARFFNQIGPGHDTRFAVPNFARQIIEMRRGLRAPVLHTGDLSVTRDFTDVRDSIRALHLLLEQGETGQSYNICSGQERSLRSVVEDLLQVAGVSATFETDGDRMRPSEQCRIVGNHAKLHALTGWLPEIPFFTTLQDILTDVETKLNV